MFRQLARLHEAHSVPRIPSMRWYVDSSSVAKPVASTINTRLKQDLKTAMRAKEKTRLSVIKGLLSDILYAEKNMATGPKFSRESDADVASVIQRAIKQRHDSVQSYRDGGRDDLASAEEDEIHILGSYLPEQLSSEQIEEHVKEVIERLGASGIKAMGAVMKEVDISPAQAPRSCIAEIAKKLLVGKA